MQSYQQIALSNFFIAGINYKKSDASIRGQFAVNNEQYEQLLALAPSYGINELLVLSTCNRTEIYGFAADADELSRLLTTQTAGSAETFRAMAYVKQGLPAIEHLYHVAAGLDSQILGDYEIVGQIKQAARIAKKGGRLGCNMERLVNEVLAASKKIRTTTGLSGGTVSVSFAAVQYIRSFFAEVKNKKILLVGAGKFGGNTCKNIADYLPGCTLTLINRTIEKAASLAAEFQVQYDHIDNLPANIAAADVILVATSANEPVILKEHFTEISGKLVIDLSVPCNVEQAVRDIKGITLVNVDDLSRIKDETLQKRAGEIPKVKRIIAAHINAFIEWHQMREHVPVLRAVKNKLLTIQADNIFDPAICITVSSVTGKSAEERIQKVINGMAVKMKTKNQRGCNYIEAINDFITPASNQ
jgi:glutamyl-tRNA reductase